VGENVQYRLTSGSGRQAKRRVEVEREKYSDLTWQDSRGVTFRNEGRLRAGQAHSYRGMQKETLLIWGENKMLPGPGTTASGRGKTHRARCRRILPAPAQPTIGISGRGFFHLFQTQTLPGFSAATCRHARSGFYYPI